MASVTRSINVLSCTAGLAIALGLAQPVVAQSVPATASMAVSATVLSFCSVVASPMAFGNYTPSANAETTATLTVTCTNGTPYNVALGLGGGPAPTLAARQMSFTVGGTTSTLNYGLFIDAPRTQPWGETVGTNTLLGTGSGAAQPLTVYGRVPAGQSPAPGLYTDTVLVSVIY